MEGISKRRSKSLVCGAPFFYELALSTQIKSIEKEISVTNYFGLILFPRVKLNVIIG